MARSADTDTAAVDEMYLMLHRGEVCGYGYGSCRGGCVGVGFGYGLGFAFGDGSGCGDGGGDGYGG